MDKQPKKIDYRWSRSRLWQISLLTLGLVAVLLVVVLGTPGRSSGNGGDQQGPDNPASNPDDLMAKSLSEKEAIEQRFQAAINQAQAFPPNRDTHPAGLDQASDPEFQTGILTGIAGPFSSQDVSVSNVWQEETEEGFLQVFAGAYGLKPEQGVLVVIRTSQDRLTAVEERYPTPDEHGAILIVEVEGGEIELHAEDGTTLFFDIVGLEYVQPD